MCRLIPIALLLFTVSDATAAEAPWWSNRWTVRQNVVSTGHWVRVPYEKTLAHGRFVDPRSQEELPHWSQTIELSEPRPIAVDPKVHFGFPRLVEARDGRLLLFYRVGTSHASDPATIAMRTSKDRGASWSAERVIHRDPDGYSAHNPVAVIAADGRVILFVSSYNFHDRRKLPMYWAHSDDHGKTWSSFTKFDTDPSCSTYYMTDIERSTDGLFGMSAGFAPDARTQCHNILWHSTDGRDWKVRSFQTLPAENRGDEVDVFHVMGDRFMVFHRDRRRQTTWRVRTEDGGRTWTEREDLGEQLEILQRPFATRLTDEVVLLSGRDAKRKLVVVYVSRDGGDSFGERHVIDSYSADGAYTSAVRLNERQALLVYYGDRPSFRGRPDIRQVTLTVHDKPTHVCFRSSTNGPIYFYSDSETTNATEDRTFAWLAPPGGWSPAKIGGRKIPRGEIPLLKQRTWSGSFPPTNDPDAIAPYWQVSKQGDANTRRETGRVLRIYDRGSGGGEFAYLGRSWEMAPGRKAEIHIEVKVISCAAPGGCMLRIADGRNEEAFTFYPDRILANRSGLEAPIDLASDFAKLRIIVKDSGYRVYSSDRELLDGRGKFTSPAYGGRQVIHFGGGSSSGQGEALWKEVRYQITEERN